EKGDKEVTHEDDDFGNVSAKKANETSQFQDWMEANSKNIENTNSKHENYSSTKELFFSESSFKQDQRFDQLRGYTNR
ncbi:unnamed protein product, partial [Brassica oleracea var. botrytis]